MMSSKQKSLRQLILAAMFLALAMVLPILTGQLQQTGNALCPMHIPVLLCGFFCGPWYALAVGAIAPLLRFLLFGMPPLMPIGIAMCFELATYGLVIGWLYGHAKWQCVKSLYRCMISAMLAGRLVWGVVRIVLLGVSGVPFGWQLLHADQI